MLRRSVYKHHPHCDQALVILGESPANKLTLPKTSVSPHKDQAWEQGSITSPLTRQGQVREIKFPELELLRGTPSL